MIAGVESPARTSVATTEPGPTSTSRAVPSVSASARWPSEYVSILSSSIERCDWDSIMPNRIRRERTPPARASQAFSRLAGSAAARLLLARRAGRGSASTGSRRRCRRSGPPGRSSRCAAAGSRVVWRPMPAQAVALAQVELACVVRFSVSLRSLNGQPRRLQRTCTRVPFCAPHDLQAHDPRRAGGGDEARAHRRRDRLQRVRAAVAVLVDLVAEDLALARGDAGRCRRRSRTGSRTPSRSRSRSIASAPSQSWSTPSFGASAAPGRIAGSASLQSSGLEMPSLSRSRTSSPLEGGVLAAAELVDVVAGDRVGAVAADDPLAEAVARQRPCRCRRRARTGRARRDRRACRCRRRRRARWRRRSRPACRCPSVPLRSSMSECTLAPSAGLAVVGHVVERSRRPRCSAENARCVEAGAAGDVVGAAAAADEVTVLRRRG